MTMPQLGLIQQDDAVFSPDGTLRYWLTRELGGLRTLSICGLNPSIANREKNDPTVRKEIGFAKRWGCGRLVKVNARAYIATDPKDMKRAMKAGVDVVGPDNADYVKRAAIAARDSGGIFVVAWGANLEDPTLQRAYYQIIRLYVMPMCLGTNHDGSPVHPLYIPYERELVEWTCPP